MLHCLLCFMCLYSGFDLLTGMMKSPRICLWIFSFFCVYFWSGESLHLYFGRKSYKTRKSISFSISDLATDFSSAYLRYSNTQSSIRLNLNHFIFDLRVLVHLRILSPSNRPSQLIFTTLLGVIIHFDWNFYLYLHFF